MKGTSVLAASLCLSFLGCGGPKGLPTTHKECEGLIDATALEECEKQAKEGEYWRQKADESFRKLRTRYEVELEKLREETFERQVRERALEKLVEKDEQRQMELNTEQ